MDRRHQVFISSTYQDLAEERAEVIQALLELDLIPAGMELFPAANEDQWTLIKRVIDDCDYYIVISAGRYGSVDSTGTGYTEKEYRYALEVGLPTLAFLHKEPAKLSVARCEQTDEGRARLEKFRAVLQGKHCKYWANPQELGSVVSRGLVQLIRTNHRPGWIRADRAAESIAADELLALRRQIESLNIQLDRQRLLPPTDTKDLAQGNDLFSYYCKVDFRKHADGSNWIRDYTSTISWDDLFGAVGPSLIGDLAEPMLQRKAEKYLETDIKIDLEDEAHEERVSVTAIKWLYEPFDSIKIQLRALGLIMKSERPRGVNDRNTYWTLTPYGDTHLTRLLAEERPSTPPE